MKNASFAFLFIVVLGILCHFFLPWWSLVLIAALAGILFEKNAAAAFAVGFLAGSTLWYGSAMLYNLPNLGDFAAQIGEILKLKTWHLLAATGTLGGLLGGFGAMTGVLGKHLVSPTHDTSRKYPKRRRKR